MKSPLTRKSMAWALIAAVAFRYGAFVIMTAMAVWNEARPAPGNLPDSLLDLVPESPLVARWNYWLWIAAWLPPTLWLLWRRPKAGVSLLFAGGWLSIIRGLTILTTGLGPVTGGDINAGMPAAERLAGVWAVANPMSSLFDDAAFVYLTKDLFFSGHVATTFLVLLYVWPIRWLRYWVLIAHLLVTASVFIARLHYSIDVIGAYAITFSFFVLAVGDPRKRVAADLGGSWSELK